MEHANLHVENINGNLILIILLASLAIHRKINLIFASDIHSKDFYSMKF